MADPAILTENLVHFTRYLRHRGLGLTPETAADLVRAAAIVGFGRADDAHDAFRAMTITHPDQTAAFDEAFDLFFGDGTHPISTAIEQIELSTQNRSPMMRVVSPAAGSEMPAEPVDVDERVGGSHAERLGMRDFGDLTPEEREQVRRLMARMVWRPADTLSRRRSPSPRGDRPDLRRTLRRMVRAEGDLLPLAMSQRRQRKRPVLILADVSGSMERYVELLLYFIHAARGRLGRVEAFVFSTRLTRITREVRDRDPSVALRRIADTVPDWSGGTRIGEALRSFNQTWSRRVVRGGPVALVISDGWDRGDPDLLRVEMARLARSVHRVVWLSPLAGRAGFAPETRGLRTVMPYVDDFLAGGTLRDLQALVRVLEAVPRHHAPRRGFAV